MINPSLRATRNLILCAAVACSAAHGQESAASFPS